MKKTHRYYLEIYIPLAVLLVGGIAVSSSLPEPDRQPVQAEVRYSMYFPTPVNDETGGQLFSRGPFPDSSEQESVLKPWSNLTADQRHRLLWPLVERLALKSHLDPALVMAVVQVESRFRPWVVSRRGAMGLMQINPVTADHLGLERPMDPMANLEAGVRYLAYLYDLFDHDMYLTLAAYNAGPTRVRELGAVPELLETKRYVEKVLVQYAYFQNHQASLAENTITR
jgi:hypothetical protein